MLYLGKSPRKLSLTEKQVINGLKQLTDVIFKPHYRHDTTNGSQSTASVTSSNVNVLNSMIATAIDANQNDKTSTDAIKENERNGDNMHKIPMKEAEQFCAMVVHQLSKNDQDITDDWHRGQLNAYALASEKLLEKNIAERTTNVSLFSNEHRVVQKLTEL